MPGRQDLNDLSTFLEKKGYDAIPFFQNGAGLLLINVKVNGIAGLFILDTGAATSVVDTKHVSLLNLILQTDNSNFSGAGAGGQGLEVIPSVGNKIEIGNHILTDFTFAVMNLEHAMQALEQAGALEEILGVIGVDILKPGKAIIDYSTMTLYLERNSDIF